MTETKIYAGISETERGESLLDPVIDWHGFTYSDIQHEWTKEGVIDVIFGTLTLIAISGFLYLFWTNVVSKI